MRGILLALALSAAATAQVPDTEQALSSKTASGPQISPDGRFVAYQVRSTNWEDNSFDTQIWLAMVPTGERYQLTSSKKSSLNPKWSPDGKRLAFISDRNGKRQIYLISTTGGEALELTTLDGGVDALQWSPDGSTIAFTSTGPEPKQRKDRKDKFGDFEIVKGDYLMSQLWVIKVPAEMPATAKEKPKPESLTAGKKFSVTEFSWAPDSQRLAFSAAANPSPAARDSSDIFVARVSDKGLTRLVSTSGPDRTPVWSPDGRRIAYQTAAGKEYFYYLNSQLAIVPAEGGKPQIIPMPFDEDPGLIDWGSDGIYFSGLQKTSRHLFRVDPESGKMQRITGPDSYVASQFSFTKDFSRMAFTGGAPNQFSEVAVSPVERFDPRPLTNVAEQYKKFKLATREVTEWKSTDGTTIQGILIKPANFDPAKKYPLLVVIHGGPTGVDLPVRAPDAYYPIERFAAKGAVLLQVNYRGSAGYGEKFRSLNVRNLGMGDYQDVISGVDALIARGFINKDRLGAMGWSQGGYISAFITCFSDRFKAVSVGAGISDWTTYYANTDITPFTRQYLKATPWEDPEIYRKTSPITYLKTARTPTLIQHGELDKRVPIPNGYELRQALEDKGVPVKMVVYKGFGHGIDKPREERAVAEHNYEWFSKWIWGESVPNGMLEIETESR
jgi:dipeptidyl aminopeptidase/acylaminoacyl peptidase